MKTNATVRIIIWSIVLVILLGILITGFAMRYYAFDFSLSESPAETAIPLETIYVTHMETSPLSDRIYSSQNSTNIYSVPHADPDKIVGEIAPGEEIDVFREERLAGETWGLIKDSGWILLEESTPDLTEAPIQTAQPGEKYTVSPDTIREINIEWVAGDILIQPGNVDAITFSEDDVSDPKYALVYKERGDELTISFCEETAGNFLGVSFGAEIVKDLTILVPTDWVCDSLEIDAASATVEINDMTIREVDFDGASGTCEFENCTIGEMDIDTASGDIRIIGSLDTLDCDAASASVYAVLSNIPSRLDMDTMSGDLEITLPEDAGFALSMGGMSTDFTSDFETTLKNGNHLCGDGSCRINIDALSGDVIIRKGEPTSHHTHTDNCTTDPNSCPDTHTHTDQCTTDPSSCPDTHTHTDQCTTDPSSCPNPEGHHNDQHHS